MPSADVARPETEGVQNEKLTRNDRVAHYILNNLESCEPVFSWFFFFSLVFGVFGFVIRSRRDPWRKPQTRVRTSCGICPSLFGCCARHALQVSNGFRSSDSVARPNPGNTEKRDTRSVTRYKHSRRPHDYHKRHHTRGNANVCHDSQTRGGIRPRAPFKYQTYIFLLLENRTKVVMFFVFFFHQIEIPCYAVQSSPFES